MVFIAVMGFGLYMPMGFGDMTGSGSCGIPAPFREVSIRDPATGEAVADGEVGELCVRGRGIMLGYYNKPEANSATAGSAPAICSAGTSAASTLSSGASRT